MSVGPDDEEPPAHGPHGLDGLRHAVYARGATDADARAYEEAVLEREAAAAAVRPERVPEGPHRPSGHHDSHPEPSQLDPPQPEPPQPDPPQPDPPRQRSDRPPIGRRPSTVFLGGGLLVAAVAVLAVLALAHAGTTSTPLPAPTPTLTSTPALDPADRSSRFREGSGGAPDALAAPVVAGLVLVARSDSGAAQASATVDALGGRLEFAIVCAGSGTVTLRLTGSSAPPMLCREGRTTPEPLVVAASELTVRYSITTRGAARWALAVGRTPATAGPTDLSTDGPTDGSSAEPAAG